MLGCYIEINFEIQLNCASKGDSNGQQVANWYRCIFKLQAKGMMHRRTPTTNKNKKERIRIEDVNADLEQSISFITGIVQMFFGTSLVILGAVSIHLGSMFRSTFVVWGGIVFPIATGFVGYWVRNEKTLRKIAYIFMSSTSAVLSLLLVVYDCIAIIIHEDHCEYDVTDYYDDYGPAKCVHNNRVVFLHGCAAIVAFMEMIVAIAAASCGCCGCCCVETILNDEEEVCDETGSSMISSDALGQHVHLHCA